MKLLILGLDGLEYNFVRLHDYKGLKQRGYGKLVIPPSCFTETNDYQGHTIYEPWTSFVWYSFLTGKTPEENKLDRADVHRWNNWLLQLLRRKGWLSGFGWLARFMGFKKRWITLKKTDTFLGAASNPTIINFPYLTRWTLKYPKSDFAGIIRFYKELFGKGTTELRSKLQGDWDVLLYYSRLLDVAGELDYDGVQKIYSYVDRRVTEIKRELPCDVTMLIISDHGIERFGETRYGKHSNHAFYSLNNQSKQEFHSILDFHPTITGWLTP